MQFKNLPIVAALVSVAAGQAVYSAPAPPVYSAPAPAPVYSTPAPVPAPVYTPAPVAPAPVCDYTSTVNSYITVTSVSYVTVPAAPSTPIAPPAPYPTAVTTPAPYMPTGTGAPPPPTVVPPPMSGAGSLSSNAIVAGLSALVAAFALL